MKLRTYIYVHSREGVEKATQYTEIISNVHPKFSIVYTLTKKYTYTLKIYTLKIYTLTKN